MIELFTKVGWSILSLTVPLLILAIFRLQTIDMTKRGWVEEHNFWIKPIQILFATSLTLLLLLLWVIPINEMLWR